MIPLRDVATLGRVRMDAEPVAPRWRLSRSATRGPQGAQLLLRDARGRAARSRAVEWRTRCLALDLPGYEDPATGSAAGPFGAWVALQGGATRILVVQGVEMGDRSDIEVDTTDGIVISGQVLVRASGSIDL